ncbi:hypothetical protein LSAT2_022574, partial [Lamellibrachia satsuma]
YRCGCKLNGGEPCCSLFSPEEMVSKRLKMIEMIPRKYINRQAFTIKWYKENGLQPKEKRNAGRANNIKAYSFDDTKQTVTFITNYADNHALILPGRVPSFKRDDIKLMPSSETKVKIHAAYSTAMCDLGHRIMSETGFRKTWKALLPFIVTARPMTDLCWTCQKNNVFIYRSANLPEADKSERLLQQEKHLLVVQQERSLYKDMVRQAKDVCCQLGIDPLQPGPIYFLVPRKVGLFGVCCEGVPKQVNFLIDESHLISKGSNAVISFLHYFFEHFGLGETEYCAWRVSISLHKTISLNFLIAGHTKFAPDGCFGLLKQAFRRHAVSSLEQFRSVVNGSARTNSAQLVGTEDGTCYVPVGDWQAHLSPSYKPLVGIKGYQHF